MFDIKTLFTDILFSPAGLVIIALIAIGLAIEVASWFWNQGPDLPHYVKKASLFDTDSERALYSILLELFGDRYYIFAQVHYSHLVQPRGDLPPHERLRYRNSVDRKSADFVLCDKEGIVPKLVIELDGSSHWLPLRKERDIFINKLMAETKIPICHLYPDSIARDVVRATIDRCLMPKRGN